MARPTHIFGRRPALRPEDGFTLIELLVVILIIGILAAIAIPSFLSQKSKATDAQAKELARTAETAAETISTDNNGDYTKVTAAELKTYEPSLNTNCAKEACLKEGTHAATSFKVIAVTPAGAEFEIEKKTTGEVSRMCKPVALGTGCPTGSW
jgi:type IV pilus assembly protein PilA